MEYGEKTKKLIVQRVKLDEIENHLTQDLGVATTDLARLQKKHVDELLEPSEGSSSAEEMAEATRQVRDKCLDLQSKIHACHLKRNELTASILPSMKSDRDKRAEELGRQAGQLRSEQENLGKNYLALMAQAAVAQLLWKGFWNEMKGRGPAFGRLKPDEHNYFAREFDRLCAEAGMNTSYRPIADRIKTRENERDAFLRPIGNEEIEAEVAKAQQAQAKG